MISWVVGRGLLGRAVEARLGAQGRGWREPNTLPWRTTGIDGALEQAAASFADAAQGGPWQVAWCAGAGVVATDEPALASETRALGALLGGLGVQRSRLARDGSLFFASSAGGVYAGSKAPPFDETVAPRPLAAYGGAKLAQEDLVRTWGAERDVRVLVGRIANLYGPGQDLAKPQGLISQLALATLQRRPLVLYVGVDTMRDYLYVTDAAAIVADSLELLRARVAPGGTVVKIVASQSSVTVGAVVAEMRRVAHVAPLVVRADTPLTAVQVRDLRLRSVVWPSLDRRPLTSLPTGLHAVVMHLRRRLAAGAVSGQPV